MVDTVKKKPNFILLTYSMNFAKKQRKKNRGKRGILDIVIIMHIYYRQRIMKGQKGPKKIGDFNGDTRKSKGQRVALRDL